MAYLEGRPYLSTHRAALLLARAVGDEVLVPERETLGSPKEEPLDDAFSRLAEQVPELPRLIGETDAGGVRPSGSAFDRLMVARLGEPGFPSWKGTDRARQLIMYRRIVRRLREMVGPSSKSSDPYVRSKHSYTVALRVALRRAGIAPEPRY